MGRMRFFPLTSRYFRHIYIHIYRYMYVSLYINRVGGDDGGAPWPLHDIVITNIVWYIAYTREVGRGV